MYSQCLCTSTLLCRLSSEELPLHCYCLVCTLVLYLKVLLCYCVCLDFQHLHLLVHGRVHVEESKTQLSWTLFIFSVFKMKWWQILNFNVLRPVPLQPGRRRQCASTDWQPPFFRRQRSGASSRRSVCCCLLQANLVSVHCEVCICEIYKK